MKNSGQMAREHFGRYSWSSDNNQANIEKHGWSFQSAALALEHGSPVSAAANRPEREGHIASLNGETIKIITERRGDEIHIISAHTNPRLASLYEQKLGEAGAIASQEVNADLEQWRDLDREQRRLAGPIVKQLQESQKAAEGEVTERSGLSDQEREERLADLKEIHFQEAVEDRKPRLAEDSVERAQLAQGQGRSLVISDERDSGDKQLTAVEQDSRAKLEDQARVENAHESSVANHEIEEHEDDISLLPEAPEQTSAEEELEREADPEDDLTR